MKVILKNSIKADPQTTSTSKGNIAANEAIENSEELKRYRSSDCGS